MLCDLGVDGNSEEKQEAEYEPSELRDHLVEIHATYVARSLLAPKLTNKTHFWLLTNIDYNASTDQSPNESANENMDAALLLNTFLAAMPVASTEKDSEGESKGQENGTALHDLFNINQLSNGGSLADYFAVPDSVKSGENNDEEFDDDESSSTPQPRPDGLQDSKAMRKATCQICNVKVCSTARQRHVYMVHIKRSDMFACSKCDYTNSNSIWEMRKHCAAQHGQEAAAVSNEEKHKAEIQKWNQMCFPDWKQKKPAFWWRNTKPQSHPIKQEEPSGLPDNMQTCWEALLNGLANGGLEEESADSVDGKSEDDSGMAVDDSGAVLSGSAIDQCDVSEMFKMEESDAADDSMSTSGTPNPTNNGVNPADDRICHICWEESRYPGRHIAQKHLKKPLYECPVCEGFGSYESCTVAKHIAKMHPAVEGAIPKSNLERYADEIRDLQSRCFPNRPMKLVRSHTGSRPRERHHCQICNTLVAQSDRQRHVYHRHLKRQRIFECPLCDFSSNYDVHRVKWHIKWIHKEDTSGVEPVSHENEYREEIDDLNEKCFPGWQHRKRPFWWLENDEAPTSSKHADDDVKPPPAKKEKEQEPPASPKKKAVTVTEKTPEWTCQLCHKEFKPSSNFLRHVAKDHLNIPLYQCPICKGHGGQDAYEVRAHMLRIHNNTDMEPVSNVDANAEQIQKVYAQCFPGRKFKNTGFEKKLTQDLKTYEEPRVQCKECGMEMKTEDRQIHVYRHHLKEPRLYECPLCDFAHHACSSDVKAHIKFSHREQPDLAPKANLITYAKEINEWNDRCFPGWINRRLPATTVEDFNRCRLCEVEVRQTSRHIAEVHLMIPLHQCPLCEYGAAESRLVRRHMKNNHKKKEIKGLEPIANVVERRTEFSELHDQCFPGRPKRLSNITISDEGRRAKCKICGMTISKKRRLQHLLERHLRKPMFKCRYCPMTSEYDKSAIEAHMTSEHSDKPHREPLSEVSKNSAEIKELAKKCFNDCDFKIA
ncbi:zinc finger protein [Aphelenchoides avenae]|nr:zinc finger protein [Aphelenchus avenae]